MRLKRIYIEITNTCNLTCSFCIQNQRPPRRMSVEEFHHVIKQVHPFGSYVYLHILGEPLSHPEVKKILDICADYDMQVNLTTNGTLLKSRRDILYEAVALRQVNISLHSFPQHEQEGYLQDVMEVCEELAKREIHVNYRLWSLGEQGLSKETAEVLRVVEDHYGIHVEEQLITRLQRLDLRDYLHLHFESVFTWPSLTHPYVGDTGRCLGMKTMCGILSDGRVVPCCLDSKGDCTLGNIFTTPFADILNRKQVQEIVQGFADNKIIEELCQHCSYRLRFNK